jgi:hypothetical protein
MFVNALGILAYFFSHTTATTPIGNSVSIQRR